MENKHIVTAEAVRAGHPDKLCDQIADRILDAHLEQDLDARVAVEVFATDGKILVAGEVTSKAKVDYKGLVYSTLRDLRYKAADLCSKLNSGIDVEVRIHEQSPDIAAAVDGEKELGAGDQGIMVGCATIETEEMLPLPVVLAQKLCKEMDHAQYILDWMGVDGKAQVSVVYDGDTPLYVKAIVISVQHERGTYYTRIVDDIIEKVVLRAIPAMQTATLSTLTAERSPASLTVAASPLPTRWKFIPAAMSEPLSTSIRIIPTAIAELQPDYRTFKNSQTASLSTGASARRTSSARSTMWITTIFSANSLGYCGRMLNRSPAILLLCMG